MVVEKCVNRLYLLYTSQNLLGTIFRVTFTMLYRRIWSIIGKYSILCCDRCGVGLKEDNQSHLRSIGGLQLALEAPGPE
jgi:hypothetical protein